MISLDAIVDEKNKCVLPRPVARWRAAVVALRLLQKEPSTRPTARQLVEALEPPTDLREFLRSIGGGHTRYVVELAVGFKDLEELKLVAHDHSREELASLLSDVLEVSEGELSVAEISAALTSLQ